MQTYNEKENVGQGEIQKYTLRTKRETGKIMVPTPALKETKCGEKPEPEWNKEGGGLRTRPRPAELPAQEGN